MGDAAPGLAHPLREVRAVGVADVSYFVFNEPGEDVRWRYYMRAGMEGRATDLPIIRRAIWRDWEWLPEAERAARRRVIKGMRRSGYSARTGEPWALPAKRSAREVCAEVVARSMTLGDPAFHDLMAYGSCWHRVNADGSLTYMPASEMVAEPLTAPAAVTPV